MRRTIQRATLSAIQRSGLGWLLRPLAAGSGAILTFHRVRPAAPAEFAPNAHLEITPEFLRQIIDWAAHRQIDVVSIDNALDRLRNGGRRFLVLTFDDGFRDNLEYALPVLNAARAPFTVYVATGFTERTANPWWMTLEKVISRSEEIAHPDETNRSLAARTVAEKRRAFAELAQWLQSVSEADQRTATDRLANRHDVDTGAMVDEAFMNWDELRQLSAEPVVTIGAHTHNHTALAKLESDAARHEVCLSADLLEQHLGSRPRHFAYPYGFPAAVGPRDHRLLSELDFDSAVLTSPGVLTKENLAAPTALPRISMNGFFQRQDYLAALISGVPFLPKKFRRKAIGSAAPSVATTQASASSG